MRPMRERSGNVTSSDPLVMLLYHLMRDHVTPGAIEELMQDIADVSAPYYFSNGWLAPHARDVAARINRATPGGDR